MQTREEAKVINDAAREEEAKILFNLYKNIDFITNISDKEKPVVVCKRQSS